jgi:hypothetical protein
MAFDWPKKLTVEQAEALASIQGVGPVIVGSELVLSKDGQRMEPKVRTVDVQKESDLTPEMIVHGPKAAGDVNGYVLVDGKTAYFEAKTGKAIGREFRTKGAAQPQGRTNTVVMASRTSQGVDRRYVTK